MKMHVATALLLVSSLGFAPAAPCAEARPRQVVVPEKRWAGEQSRGLTREIILATEWRLFTMTISVMPLAGYPIVFRDDGSVKTENLGSISRWALSEDGRLGLLGDDGTVHYTFEYDAPNGMLYYEHLAGGFKGNLLLIGPAGSDFISYKRPRRL